MTEYLPVEHRTCTLCNRPFARTTVVSGFLKPEWCWACWDRQTNRQKYRAPVEVPVEIEEEPVEVEIELEGEEDEVKVHTAEAQEALVVAKDLPITCQDDLDLAAEVLTDVKTRSKALAALKATVTKPLQEALNAARALFKPAEEALAAIEVEIKTKVRDYEKSQAQAAQLAAEALRKAETSAQAGAALAARAQAEVKAPKGVTLSKVWKYEIVNPYAVPAAYTKVDETLIRRAVAEGVREIPGVRIFQDTQVAVKAR